jgi:hypothetical protein
MMCTITHRRPYIVKQKRKDNHAKTIVHHIGENFNEAWSCGQHGLKMNLPHLQHHHCGNLTRLMLEKSVQIHVEPASTIVPIIQETAFVQSKLVLRQEASYVAVHVRVRPLSGTFQVYYHGLADARLLAQRLPIRYHQHAALSLEVMGQSRLEMMAYCYPYPYFYVPWISTPFLY